jgi:hypothetical protein
MAFFGGAKSMQFMLPDKPIPNDAEVAVLIGLHGIIGGPWKLVYLFKRLRCVHMYECVSHGHQWWFSLHMTSDYRYTLRDLQQSSADRQVYKIFRDKRHFYFPNCI